MQHRALVKRQEISYEKQRAFCLRAGIKPPARPAISGPLPKILEPAAHLIITQTRKFSAGSSRRKVWQFFTTWPIVIWNASNYPQLLNFIGCNPDEMGRKRTTWSKVPIIFSASTGYRISVQTNLLISTVLYCKQRAMAFYFLLYFATGDWQPHLQKSTQSNAYETWQVMNPRNYPLRLKFHHTMASHCFTQQGVIGYTSHLYALTSRSSTQH